ASTVRLGIPGGTYALRLEKPEGAAPPIRRVAAQIPRSWLLAMAVAALAVASFVLGRGSDEAVGAAPINEIWEPFVRSDRPIMIVVGDYYLVGEIDPVRPE